MRHLTAALNEVTGVVHVDVDLSKNEAVVDHLLDRVNETDSIAAINHAGYQASAVASSAEPTDLPSQPARARRSTSCCRG
jgi:copper chaperone CopZ